MKRLARVFALVALVMTMPSVTSSAPAKESRDHVKGKAGAAIRDWLQAASKKGFSGSVLAAKGGKVVAAIGVGHADLAGKVPNTPATLFEVASFSKQFTAAAAVRLAEQGKLKLDDPIAKHLPGVPENCAAITVRHLLQHTSGIPGSNAAGGGDSLEHVLPLFLKGGPKHEPGTHWEYWNQGYALATEVIARAGKASFTEYCKRELFAKAKMKWTLFNGDPAPKKTTVAIGRSKHGKPRSALEHPYGSSYGFQYRGMGGVVTSVWDLWRWDRALAGKLLTKASRAQLFKPGLNDYALGWFVREERGRLVQSHTGSVRGFVCEGRRYPEHDACVFVPTNDDATPLGTITTAVEQLLFGERVTVAMPSPGDAKEGAFLVGAYTDKEGSKLTIEIVSDTIRAHVEWVKITPSRMTIAKDDSGVFAVFVNADRYDLKVIERKGEKAAALGLWGRVFRRKAP